MNNDKYKFILGSQSPRRKELLQSTFLDFTVHIANINEVSAKNATHEIAMDIAKQKANAVFQKLSLENKVDNYFVLGADTMVIINNEILGKPHDNKTAKEMLKKLSGQCHEVITGVSFVTKNKQIEFYEKTNVYFDLIDNDLLEHYLATGDSLDKAGAYGIQAQALGFISKIEGSYSNVVGLPVDKVLLNIKAFFNLENDRTGKWRQHFE